MAQENQRNQQPQTAVAVIAAPRLPAPANIADYDLTEDTWRAVVDAVFPLAKTVGAVVMALAYAKRMNVDIFQRNLHIVPIRVGQNTVESVWPGIALLRTIAQRQASFGGWLEPEEGPEVEHKWSAKVQQWNNGQRSGFKDVQVTLKFPEWVRYTYIKIIGGKPIELKGPKTYFLESFTPISAYDDVPNARWCRSPRQMIHKNAEAAALRMCWPDVFGGMNTFEEMEGRELDEGSIEGEYTVVTEDAPPKPTRKGKEAPDAQAEAIQKAVKDAIDNGVIKGEADSVSESAERLLKAGEKLAEDTAKGSAEAGEEVDQNSPLEEDLVHNHQDEEEGQAEDDVGDGPSLGDQAAASLEREKQRGPSTKEMPAADPPTSEEPLTQSEMDEWVSWKLQVISKIKMANEVGKITTAIDFYSSDLASAPEEIRAAVLEQRDASLAALQGSGS